MTYGLACGDIVHVKNTLTIGKIIGIDDWSERWPADLAIVHEDRGEICQLKIRADEVTKLKNVDASLVGV